MGFFFFSFSQEPNRENPLNNSIIFFFEENSSIDEYTKY